MDNQGSQQEFQQTHDANRCDRYSIVADDSGGFEGAEKKHNIAGKQDSGAV
jgi:hypothetical protein